MFCLDYTNFSISFKISYSTKNLTIRSALVVSSYYYLSWRPKTNRLRKLDQNNQKSSWLWARKKLMGYYTTKKLHISWKLFTQNWLIVIIIIYQLNILELRKLENYLHKILLANFLPKYSNLCERLWYLFGFKNSKI